MMSPIRAAFSYPVDPRGGPRKYSKHIPRRLALALSVLTAVAAPFALPHPAVGAPADAPTADPTPPGKPRFDSTGAKVGEQLPNLPVYTLEGKQTSLHEAWTGGRPTLLLTSSFTCPKSRSTYPRADELAKRLEKKLSVAVIYVVEAHPKGDPSPYKGVEDVTVENERARVFCRQPATLDERLKLAGRFKQRLSVSVPIFVDAMDNAAWKQLGGGPNMGVLVRPNGIIVARQGWFDADSMGKAIQAFLAAAEREEKAREAAGPTKQSGLPDWEFSRAARNGNLEGLKRQLEKQPDLVHKTDSYSARGSEGGKTLLHYAAEGGHAAVAEFLLSRGADPDAFNEYTATPLHLAASHPGAHSGETVAALLKGGAHADPKGWVGPSPLQEAILRANRPAIDLLLKAGAKTNLYTDAGLDKLADLRRRLNTDPTLALRPDGAGRGPLAYAAGNGQLEAAKLLISYGAKDMPADEGESLALYWAIQAKDLPMVKLLLDNGSSPDGALWSEPFVHVVVRDGSKESVLILKALLAHKANARAGNMRGYEPLHTAAMRDEEPPAEAIESLLAAGADVNARVGADHSPCGPSEVFDLPHETVLQVAASAGAKENVRVLLAHGAKIDSRDGQARTPLHSAAGAEPGPNALTIVRLLLDKGAAVNVKDNEGLTPLDLALKANESAEKKDPAVIDLLRARGGKPGAEVAGPNGKPEPFNKDGKGGRSPEPAE